MRMLEVGRVWRFDDDDDRSNLQSIRATGCYNSSWRVSHNVGVCAAGALLRLAEFEGQCPNEKLVISWLSVLKKSDVAVLFCARYVPVRCVRRGGSGLVRSLFLLHVANDFELLFSFLNAILRGE